jgi:DNA modification methylase
MGLLRKGEDNANNSQRCHPSQKPVELMMWCLEAVRVGISKTVFDPYMGSGSTGVAALRTGRNFVGVEIDPRYFEIAVERIKRELAQGDLFLANGKVSDGL